jgi:hypothetical protein
MIESQQINKKVTILQCRDLFKERRQAASIFCSKLDQWVAINYCENSCQKRTS